MNMIFGYIFFMMLWYSILILRFVKQFEVYSISASVPLWSENIMICGFHGALCARGDARYIRLKQTFSKWDTGMELATSGRHDTSESTTYIYIYSWHF